MREWAQVIDANPAGDALWYEFWSLDRQERFSLKIKDGKALSIGNIVRVEEEAGRPALKALEFTSVPLKFRDKTLVDAVSFKPKGKNGFEPGPLLRPFEPGESS